MHVNSKDVKEIIFLFKKNSNAEIGFHAHDQYGPIASKIMF